MQSSNTSQQNRIYNIVRWSNADSQSRGNGKHSSEYINETSDGVAVVPNIFAKNKTPKPEVERSLP